MYTKYSWIVSDIDKIFQTTKNILMLQRNQEKIFDWLQIGEESKIDKRKDRMGEWYQNCKSVKCCWRVINRHGDQQQQQRQHQQQQCWWQQRGSSGQYEGQIVSYPLLQIVFSICKVNQKHLIFNILSLLMAFAFEILPSLLIAFKYVYYIWSEAW